MGGSKVITALPSETIARGFRTTDGTPAGIPISGLLRKSNIIAVSSGPSSWKVSPGPKFGVITASLPDALKVSSSR